VGRAKIRKMSFFDYTACVWVADRCPSLSLPVHSFERGTTEKRLILERFHRIGPTIPNPQLTKLVDGKLKVKRR
jgi:hypothetical protein